MGVDGTDRQLHDESVAHLTEERLAPFLDDALAGGRVAIAHGVEELNEFRPDLVAGVLGRFSWWLRGDGCLVDLKANVAHADATPLRELLPCRFVSLAWPVGGMRNAGLKKRLEEALGTGEVDFREPVLECLTPFLVQRCPDVLSRHRSERLDGAIKISVLMLSGLDNRIVAERMLRSIRETVPAAGDVELVFVSNGSRDGTADSALRILGDDHELQIVHGPANRGIAGGINHGLRVCRGEHVAFVQDDVRLTRRDWHREMSWYLDRNPRMGVLGGHRGGFYYRLPDAQPWEVPYTSVGFWDWEPLRRSLVQVDTANWILCMFRRELGGFDEAFLPNGLGDHDFNYRARREGWEIWATDMGVEHDLHDHGDSVTRRQGFDRSYVHRLSRLYHYREFMDRHGDLLRELPPAGVPSLEELESRLVTRPRDFGLAERAPAPAVATVAAAATLPRSFRDLARPHASSS